MKRAKKVSVSNDAIISFYNECQEVVSRWNANRHDGGGEINVCLEEASTLTTQKIIRIDAKPYPSGTSGRMTMLQIWFNAESSFFLGKTPGLPIDNTEKITIDMLHRILENFNP